MAPRTKPEKTQMDDLERGEPNRLITKLEGVRHILHSAIRCHLAGEDGFAVNILAQSAERVLIDSLKANGISDPFYSLLKPERRAEFLAAYREPVNFLKHADRDHDDLLPVYDIVRAADLALFGAIIRYLCLGEQWTCHMRIFVIFIAAQYPNTINVEALPGLKEVIESGYVGKSTRGELAADLTTAISAQCQQERFIDLADVDAANARPIVAT
jgi:hypothetical protein